MRAFEFQAGELIDPDGPPQVMIVDLDSIVRLHDHLDAIGRRHYFVNCSDGAQLWVTKPAFERILVAWKSN